MKISRNIALTSICIILGVMIAWQYKSVNYNQNVSSYQSKRSEELKDEIISLKDRNDQLRNRLKELEDENRIYKTYSEDDSEIIANLNRKIEEAQTFAGLTAVKGKGVIITLDNNGIMYVEDYDILNIINELRASGAQAISVNEERIAAMTEIRTAGKYIMVNGIQMEAPFVIKAISDPNKLERSLTIIDGVIERLENWSQLKVNVKKADNIVIPKVRDDGSVIRIDLLTAVE